MYSGPHKIEESAFYRKQHSCSEQGYETKLIKVKNSKYKMNSTEYNVGRLSVQLNVHTADVTRYYTWYHSLVNHNHLYKSAYI